MDFPLSPSNAPNREDFPNLRGTETRSKMNVKAKLTHEIWQVDDDGQTRLRRNVSDNFN